MLDIIKHRLHVCLAAGCGHPHHSNFISTFCHREQKGWNTKASLLMDGGNENPDINLRKEIFWPDNIVEVMSYTSVNETNYVPG